MTTSTSPIPAFHHGFNHSDNDTTTLLSSSSSSETTTSTTRMGPPLITDEQMAQIHIYTNIVFRGLISLVGVATNVINIAVFQKLGVKDSMSVGLMTLSITDFLVTFLGLAGTLCFVMDVYYPHGPIDPLAFHYIFVGWNRDIFYVISGWITTFLSVERCVCVVFPFKVKQIFTRGRSIVAMATIYLVIIAIHAPVLATQWLVWTQIEVPLQTAASQKTIDVPGNISPNITDTGNDHGVTGQSSDSSEMSKFRSQLVLAFSDNRDDIFIYIDVANGAVLPIPSQIIVFVSVILMIYGLRASASIRTTNLSNAKKDCKDRDSKSNSNSSSKTESKLSSKEGRLVKVVLFLAIILTVCNIPRFMAVYTKQLFPKVNFGQQYRNLYTLLWNLAAIMAIVNSSINIMVYLIVNANYRNRLREMIRIREDKLSSVDHAKSDM